VPFVPAVAPRDVVARQSAGRPSARRADPLSCAAEPFGTVWARSDGAVVRRGRPASRRPVGGPRRRAGHRPGGIRPGAGPLRRPWTYPWKADGSTGNATG